jgi:nucleotide-binding universal stress UspA family protein
MKPFENVLVAIDFSENSTYAFKYALELVKQFKGELTIIHVIHEPDDTAQILFSYISRELLEKAVMEDATKMMEKFCSEEMGGFTNYKTVIARGIPYQEIVMESQKIVATLVVMGTHGYTGIEHLIFGSTAERVVRSASCPVLTVRLPVITIRLPVGEELPEAVPAG